MTTFRAGKIPRPVAAALAAAALLLLSSPARAQGSDPKAVLKAMSDYVISQKTIEFTYDSDIEVITPQLEKIQFTSSGETLLSRPDKMRAHRVSGHADVSLFFDGKTVSVFGKSHDSWTQFEAPGTVDQLVAASALVSTGHQRSVASPM